MNRSEPALTAAQTPCERTTEPAFNGVELLPTGEEGRAAKAALPEYKDSVKVAIPGWSSRFSGSENGDDTLNPAEGDRDADDAVKALWRSCGLVSEAYWPGRRWIWVWAFGPERTAPRVTFENPCRHCPGVQTTKGCCAVTKHEPTISDAIKRLACMCRNTVKRGS
jgi:hypothetical protein